MTVQYKASGGNMKAVKTSVWNVFYRAFPVPPSNRKQTGVRRTICKGARGQRALSGHDMAATSGLKQVTVVNKIFCHCCKKALLTLFIFWTDNQNRFHSVVLFILVEVHLEISGITSNLKHCNLVSTLLDNTLIWCYSKVCFISCSH